MEQLLNLDALTTIAEAELIYKSKVKPSKCHWQTAQVNVTSEGYYSFADEGLL